MSDARMTLEMPAPREAGGATDALVDAFAAALKAKLRAAEAKHGWNSGWLDPACVPELRAEMLRHIAKGDPRDVAAYAAFLWFHGEPTVEGGRPAPVDPGGRNEVFSSFGTNSQAAPDRAALCQSVAAGSHR